MWPGSPSRMGSKVAGRSSLAPVVVHLLKEQLKQLKQTGMTMILTEQNVRFVSELGDRVYILEKGTICYESSMPEFLANPEVRQTYLAV